MMKHIWILAVSGFLFGCSSSPEKPVVGSPAAPAVTSEPGQPVKEAAKEEVKPEAPAAKLTELGMAINSGNQEKIKQVSTDILINNPKDVPALNALAMYYLAKQQPEAAMLLLDKALSYNPKSSEILNNIGLVAQSKGEKKEAITTFRKALEMDAHNYSAASNLAAIYVEEKDYNKTIFTLESFERDGSADADGLNNYAIALSAMGRTNEAATVYEKILKANAGNKNALFNYSILMIAKLQKYKEGLDLINRLKFVGPELGSRPIIKDLEIKAKAGLK